MQSPAYYHQDSRTRRCVDQLKEGALFNEAYEFQGLYDHLLQGKSEFLELQDFNSYLEAQQALDRLFRDDARRWKMAGLNIAASGRFSSDCTVRAYAGKSGTSTLSTTKKNGNTKFVFPFFFVIA